MPPSISFDHTTVAPQLAIVAVLEATVDITIVALRAAYPELQNLDHNTHDELRDVANVIELARALAITIRRFRRTLIEAIERDDAPLPF